MHSIRSDTPYAASGSSFYTLPAFNRLTAAPWTGCSLSCTVSGEFHYNHVRLLDIVLIPVLLVDRTEEGGDPGSDGVEAVCCWGLR